MFGSLLKRTLAAASPSAVIVRARANAGSAIALTFDDGPHPDITPAILDTLDRAGAKGTFFLVGQRAVTHSALVREIHARGHQVANHGFHHRNARRMAAKEFVADALRTHDALEDIVGSRLARDFRPPNGIITAATFVRLRDSGLRQVYWSVDSLDYSVGAPEPLARDLPGRISAGDIVLLHDDYTHTAVALESIVPEISARHLTFSVVQDLR